MSTPSRSRSKQLATAAPTLARPRRKRLVAAIFVVAAWVVLVAIILMRGHTSRSALAAPPEPETAAPPPVLALAAPTPALAHSVAPVSEPPFDPKLEAPIIDEVTVEHKEVCEGEENLISVKAHTLGGRGDAFLHYFIGTQTGQAVPVRSVIPAPGLATPGPMTIRVFGRNNTATSVPMPEYTVKRCQPDRSLFLRSRYVPNSPDELEFVAIIQELRPSSPMRVTSYRWEFGDGEQVITAGSTATHHFAIKNANTLYSEFLVKCEAMGADGRRVMGRMAVSLRNLEFENLAFHKTLVLSVELTPHFPQLDSHGRVVQTVRLYHHQNAPVRLEQAQLTYVKNSDGQEESVDAHSVGELLGSDEVPPGRGVTQTFQLDPAEHLGTRMLNYTFKGYTFDGIPAVANFSIMVPPAPPTRETGTPVTDRLLTQKILRARERLGKQFVNDEDLIKLEHEGAFDDFKAAPSPSGAASSQLTSAQLAEARAVKEGTR